MAKFQTVFKTNSAKAAVNGVFYNPPDKMQIGHHLQGGAAKDTITTIQLISHSEGSTPNQAVFYAEWTNSGAQRVWIDTVYLVNDPLAITFPTGNEIIFIQDDLAAQDWVKVISTQLIEIEIIVEYIPDTGVALEYASALAKAFRTGSTI